MYECVIESRTVVESTVLGYCDIPDLMYNFERLAKEHGARVTRLEGSGIVFAMKGRKQLFMTVRHTDRTYPCRDVLSMLSAAMDGMFGIPEETK